MKGWISGFVRDEIKLNPGLENAAKRGALTISMPPDIFTILKGAGALKKMQGGVFLLTLYEGEIYLIRAIKLAGLDSVKLQING